MKRSLFLTSFLITFPLIAFLCMATRQPLLFSPIDYGAGSFFQLAVIVFVLCFLLVYVTLPFLNALRNGLGFRGRAEAVFVIGAFIILQAATMLIGYSESSLTPGVRPNFFYYYKGAGNSHIYLAAGNFTTLIIASLNNRLLVKKEKEKEGLRIGL